MTATVQRLIGTCQICEGTFKLDQGAKMVHHGYKRPGLGYIVGDCAAVGHPAYEQSCECLKAYTGSLAAMLAEGQKYLRKLKTGEITELTAVSRKTRYRVKSQQVTVTYKVGDAEWGDILDSKVRETARANEWFVQDIARCEARIAAWKPLPIRTIQEAEAEARADREAAKVVKDAKKAAKLQAKIEGYQKRIDSAVRRHTTTTLCDIFETAPSKLREIAGYQVLSRAQALMLLDRGHVWAAFGLDPQQDDRSEPNQTILRKMFSDTSGAYPWPEGL